MTLDRSNKNSGENPSVARVNHLRRFAASNLARAFAEQVIAHRDSIALRDGHSKLSYRGLDRLSNKVAIELRAMGVRKGDTVGYLGVRSIEAVAVFLAILKCGAAYVPLDPDQPDDGLRFIVEDSNCRVVVRQRGMQHRITGITTSVFHDLADGLSSDAGATEFKNADASTEDCAYVMYTSGSTGKPKGVRIPHRAILRLVTDQNFFEFGAGQRFLLCSPLAFDASTLEIWGALLHGAELGVVAEQQLGLKDYGRAISTFKPTILWLTSGLFNALVDHDPSVFAGVGTLMTGGDVLSPEHVLRAMDAQPGIRFVNGYGPTENTTFTCCHEISRDDLTAGEAIPIGRVISHSTGYVLDPDLNPVPVGETGILWSGGAGVGLGYLERPDLTKRVFQPDPFADDGSLMYCTGDLVRQDENGLFHFEGRADRQVKIEGKRIELDEIELAYRADTDVRDAIIFVREVNDTKLIEACLLLEDGVCEHNFQPEIDERMRARLPNYMMPRHIHLLAAFPLNRNGKVDRRALVEMTAREMIRASDVSTTSADCLSTIFAKFGSGETPDPETNFFDLGLTSLQMMRAHAEIEQRTGVSLNVTDLFAHPSIAKLAAFIDTKQGETRPKVTPAFDVQVLSSSDDRKQELDAHRFEDGFAIVGMSGRFPNARNVDEFWDNLIAGRDCISHFAPNELADSFSGDERSKANYVPARSVLQDVDQFDAAFFGMNGREASLTDPQHRIFLECAWEALEDAGIDPKRFGAPIGVYAGCSMATYFMTQVCQTPEDFARFTSNYQVGSYQELVGSLQDTLATRVAYKLGLTGPAVAVQSACSTSLLAVAQACQSLQTGQCRAVLAGGVSITFPQERGYFYQDGGMVSPDGIVRPYDENARGTVFGSGCGVVTLKPVQDALEDGDRIYAVIGGYGVNNDGGSAAGFTAPSVSGQAGAIEAALKMSGVSSDQIGYVEGHGTATPLGDPIEFAALSKAFENTSDGSRSAPCLLGTAKANVGHLDAAAGVTGLIKTALSLSHETLPGLLHFTKSNPAIDATENGFAFSAEPQDWVRSDEPRRAGVSSFGVGGTNVHVVLEDAPSPPARTPQAHRSLVLPVSAKTEAGLTQRTEELVRALEKGSFDLMDVSATLQHRHQAFNKRCAVVANTIDQAVAKLKTAASTQSNLDVGDVAFLFPGQGAQFGGMGRQLYRENDVYRSVIDRGAEQLEGITGLDIRTFLLADTEDANVTLQRTEFAQPAIFLTSVAMAEALRAVGIVPDVLIGHSVGEFAGAHLSGVLSFEDALMLIAERGRLMQALPEGAMVSARLSADDAAAYLADGLSIAAINCPKACVFAGPVSAIDGLEMRLSRDDVACQRLKTSHAFHSEMMQSMQNAFATCLDRVTFHAPTQRLVSSVTGDLLGAHTDFKAHFVHQCTDPVLFDDAVRCGFGSQVTAIEVGPGRALSSFVTAIVRGSDTSATCIATLRRDQDADGAADFLNCIANIWSMGGNIDWSAVNTHKPYRHVRLPSYPFQRKRYWVETRDQTLKTVSASATVPPTSSEFNSQPVPTAEILPNAEPIMTTPQDNLVPELIAMLEELSGDDIPDDETTANFLELGFDSLLLGQVSQRIERDYSVEVPFRTLMTDVTTIEALAAHLKDKGVSREVASVAPVAAPTAAAPDEQTGSAQQSLAVPPQVSVGDGSTASIMQAQLDAMQQLISQQLATLSGGRAAPVTASTVAPPAPEPSAPVADERPPLPTDTGKSRFDVYKNSDADAEITDEQKRFIHNLCDAYSKKTPSSKAYAEEHRNALADPRTASGFRAEWKELVYSLVVPKAKGSKIWDADGNCYVDLVNGYGQTAFGHSPDFVIDAVKAQLDDGFAIGPQSPLAGEVAQMFCEMTGNERVTFCNTGSEAVMAAMRVARTVTGRKLVVMFGGAYHGQFDEVLTRQGRKKSLPIAPGIPPESVANIIVLPYGNAESLEWVRSQAGDLAAVIVETVQSRHPDLQPRDFIQELREITDRSGTALVFDEVVTGFRVHPGGMQAKFGIRADMATYGKVLGGGMPVGVLAGCNRFMDALDGGAWQFGDDSVPEVAPTFFAGTFVRHPLVLAAVKSVLEHLRANTSMLDELADTTHGLVERLNGHLADRGIATRLETFASWFYMDIAKEHPLASLFYPSMRLRGVHIQEGFPCFLTTAHSVEDITAIETAFVESLDALQAVGILAPQDQRTLSVPPHGSEFGNLPATISPTDPQKEIYLAAQFGDAASCAFNESVSVDIRGTLDLNALATALNRIVARHDALRSSLGETGEHLTVADDLKLKLPLVNLVDDPERDDSFAMLLDKDARTPFDLANGPLIRGTVVKLGTDHHTLVLTAHHIVADGWSLNTILVELSAIYSALQDGRSDAGLSSLLPFRAYAQTLGKTRTADRDYWVGQYENAPEPMALPTDRKRPESKSFAGATLTETIDADLYKQAKKAAGRMGCTLYAALFGGLQCVLARLSGQTDLPLVTPLAGQMKIGDQSLVGHCVNFLPIRVPIQTDETFASHIKRVQEKVLEAQDHQDFTFGSLVQSIDVPRSLHRTPITDVQFNLERLADDLNFGGATGTMTPNPKAFVNFDLFFNIAESRDGLRIDVDYSTDLYEAETVRRWIGYLRELLRGMVDSADTPALKMPLLSDRETRWLVDELNQTERPYPKDSVLPTLFEERVDTDGDAVAVRSGDITLTYAELDRTANKIAAFINSRMGDDRRRVAVALPRSEKLIACLLGVLKSGRAYVPLDPSHPADRLRKTVERADVGLTVCAVDDAFEWCDRDHSVALNAIDLDSFSDSRPNNSIGKSEDAAYVIFTSGSTGEPKGVEVSHRALINFLSSMKERPGISSKDTLVAVTTPCFDIAALEMFLPLVVGGQVVVASESDVTEVFPLLSLIQKTAPDIIQATPTLWRMILEAGFAPPKKLRIFCGGEPLPSDLAAKLTANGATLWNLYGPTETTIWSSVQKISPNAPIYIGAPIANTQMYVMDANGQILPTGAAGELVIGGDGLANGYFNADALTNSVFRQQDIPTRGAQRLYHTGDLARRLSDGSLQLLGRRDQQIKLRGHRIELGEIEATIRKAPNVDDCAVVLQGSDIGSKRLVGLVVGSAADFDTIERYAKSVLPDYEVPTAWQSVSSLPQTGNGKLDRKNLPGLVKGRGASRRPKSAKEIAAPEGRIETDIARIWSDVLDETIQNRDAKLFQYGADSIHVFRISAAGREAGLDMSAQRLLRNPSIRTLAELIEADIPTGEQPRPTNTKMQKSLAPSLSDFCYGAMRGKRLTGK